MNKPFLIAECGINHNGDVDVAKKLIDVSCLSGANAVKFQSWKTSTLPLTNARKLGV